MAEEKETIQKPKVELIKKPQVEHDSSEPRSASVKEPQASRDLQSQKDSQSQRESANSGDPVERRKVIIRAKKPAADASKKKTPKKVVAVPAEGIAPEITETEALHQSNSVIPANEKVHPAPAGDAVPAVSVPAVKTFQENTRPAAAAGKVGGKYVGKRENSSGDSRPSGDFRSHEQRSSADSKGPMGRGPSQFNNRQGGRNGPPSGGTGPRQQGGRPDGRFQPRTQGPHGNQRPDSFRPDRPGFQRRPGGGPLPGRPGPGGRPGQTPPIMESGKGPTKKTFKPKRPVHTRREKEKEMEEKLLQTKKKIAQVANPVPKSIEIMEVISVSELARKMNLKASDLIQKLMSMGMMVSINQQIDAETASILASEFGADVKIVSLYEETLIATGSDEGAFMRPRPPVITVMGHVDHGKTKLLDAIRKADVVSGEFGGITQHIGAYIVETIHGRLTFLDTPGHEAFTRMRARGAQVTDIVVLVVAADDGVMPQTVEAINHAKEAKVPIIVAVNKIDKPEANPDRVKTQLSEYGLIPEAWGGNTMFVEVSALKKEGIDILLEAILLEAEILDLKANYDCPAEGKVLESRIDHGRGIVATVLIERGTLRIGDSFVAGIWPGKVRGLFTDKGDRIEEAAPSMPIEVLGFEGIPNAGDPLQVVDGERQARQISGKRQELKRFEDAKNTTKITMDNLHDMISDGAIQELKVIIKADVQGSAEALKSSLEKLSTREIRLHVIQALPGAINEGDVDLASASNAIIIGFNVRPVPKAKLLAEQEKVDIRRYNIIYKAVEEIEQAMEGMLKPDTKEETIASVEIRDTFKTPKFGTIAGCFVLSGNVKRTASVHVIRDSIEIFTGKISSLRRFKDDVREVASGYECGIGIEGFNDIKPMDQLEVFEMVEVARKLSST